MKGKTGLEKGIRLCLVSSYPPNRGRLSEYTKDLALRLSDRREISHIQVLADKVNGKQNHAIEEKGIEVSRTWQPDNPISILALIPSIVRLRPDIVHFNTHFQSFGKSRLANFIGLCLAPLLGLFGFKVITTMHNFGDIVDLEKVEVRNHIVNRLAIFLVTKFLLAKSNVVVTVESYIERLSGRYGFNNMRYIPHGTSVEGQKTNANARKRILMFGHMGPYKGLPVLMECFESIKRKRSDIDLVVAGSSHPNFPDYLNAFEKDYQDVTFTGYVPEEKLSSVFNMASVVVLPYLTATGTSGVFHKSCSYGKPIIVSDLPEFRELVREGASAVITEPGDADSLEESILRVLDNEKLASEMGSKNLEYAKSESWEVISKRYSEAYSSLLFKN